MRLFCLFNSTYFVNIVKYIQQNGAIRESFFLNHLRNAGFLVTLPKSGDFLVNNQYTFETGGRNKKDMQVKDIPNAYIVSDDLEIGALRKIPLWLFGFLY